MINMSNKIYSQDVFVIVNDDKKEYYKTIKSKDGLLQANKIVNGNIDISKVYLIPQEKATKTSVIRITVDQKDMGRIKTPLFDGELKLKPTKQFQRLIDGYIIKNERFKTNVRDEFIILVMCPYNGKVYCNCISALRGTKLIKREGEQPYREFFVKLRVKVIH